jgi:hypothetical protein
VTENWAVKKRPILVTRSFIIFKYDSSSISDSGVFNALEVDLEQKLGHHVDLCTGVRTYQLSTAP